MCPELSPILEAPSTLQTKYPKMPTTLHPKPKAGRKAKDPKTASHSASGASSPQPTPEFNQYSLVEIKFRDRLGRLCSLGEGFPTKVPTVMLGGAAPAERIGELSRMDLDQQQIEYLLPFLQHFVKTGKLPAPETTKPEELGRPVTSQ
jgi:hypothetical protein